MSESSVVIVRTSSVMVVLPSIPGRAAWSLADSPRSAGVHGLHRRDVRVVCGDCQNVVSHGCFSFPYRAGSAELSADSPRSAGEYGFHGRDVRVVCRDCQDVFTHGLPSFLFCSLSAARSGGFVRPGTGLDSIGHFCCQLGGVCAVTRSSAGSGGYREIRGRRLGVCSG